MQTEEVGEISVVIPMTDKEAKNNAHGKLDQLHAIFEMYNNKELENDTKFKAILSLFQQQAQEAKKLVVFLYEKENCTATRAYMVFTARMLIRLSSLIHNDRVETVEERLDHIRAVKKKYGMDNLTEREMMMDVEASL